ncbi:24820_t:CDS:2 [Cetraspora pellucida]|uniref:24820_t:CDS:1 n=1 Tax=Cetraspora pellucida TaxID=1433469 RepID=A0A9N9H9X3_9GLOM|nr:24820_t:CDS:2 [Cetraspora pellucida]
MGHLDRRQNNNTVIRASTAASGNACPTAPVAITTTVNSSVSTVSTITGSTTSFVTITGQSVPRVITTTLPAINFNKPLTARNEDIPSEAYKVASDFKSITSKRGFSNCGGIMNLDDFRILYSASKKTFIPYFKGRTQIVVNNASARLYVQVYGTSAALEFNGPCFGAKNASPCTSGNVIDSGNTFDNPAAQAIGASLIKYGYFSLIESLGGYAILTIQTGKNDPYLACAVTKIADDDNMADTLVSPSAATAYTATSAAVGVVCLAIAAGGVVTVATVGTDAPPQHVNLDHGHHITHNGHGHNGHHIPHNGHGHNGHHIPHDGHGHNGQHWQHEQQPVDQEYHASSGIKTYHEGGVKVISADPGQHIGGNTGGTPSGDPGQNIGGNMGGTPSGDPGQNIGGEMGGTPSGGDPQVTAAPSHVQYPSFYDFMFYTQSIIATGWISLNLTSEYRKFTSTFSWACAQGFINLNILVSAANKLRYNICSIIVSMNTNVASAPGTCVDSDNGYMLPPVGSNTTLTFGPNFPTNTVINLNGFDSYAHIIGIPVEDLPFTSMIGFLVVMAIAITTVLLSAIIASIVIKYRQNAPEFWITMRNNIHLFLFALTIYQLSYTNDCWMLLFLASFILAFIVFMHSFSMIQIHKQIKSGNLDSLMTENKYKIIYSALYNQYRPSEYKFHKYTIIHTVTRACVIGALQSSGEIQLGGLLLIEFFYLVLLINHKPYTDRIFGNNLNIVLSVARLLVIILLVPFVQTLSNFVPPNILKIFSFTLIIVQAVILGSLGIMIIAKLVRLMINSWRRSRWCMKSEAIITE